METLIKAYIESKRNAWSTTTQKSELSRLNQIFHRQKTIHSPQAVWNQLKTRGAYTRKTSWTRLVDFYDWMIENDHAKAPNPFARWRKENAKVFKNVYIRDVPDITFGQAKILVDSIQHEEIRNRAKLILFSGLRYFECDRVLGTLVNGKGDKRREVFLPSIAGPVWRGAYWEFYRELKKVGLKPHMLRKVFATELHRQGHSDFDICKIMGWESLETAKAYIAPKTKEELGKKISEGIHSKF